MEKEDNNEESTMCKILEEIGGLTASQLLEKYEISLEPPIDLNKLIKKIGILVFPTEFSELEDTVGRKRGDIVGAAVSIGDDLDIMYASGLKYNRMRFTIAHELGHCCLHSENLKINHYELRTDSESNTIKEIQANIFAGQLLIPEQSLREICQSLLRPTLSALMTIFQVSANVMRGRLEYLNISVIDDVLEGSFEQ